MTDERMKVNSIVKDNFVLQTLSSKAPGILPILLYKKRQPGLLSFHSKQILLPNANYRVFFQATLNIVINHI